MPELKTLISPKLTSSTPCDDVAGKEALMCAASYIVQEHGLPATGRIIAQGNTNHGNGKEMDWFSRRWKSSGRLPHI